MSERNRPELDADWIRAMVAKEEELGPLPPGGASGGFGARRGTLVHQDDEGLTTAPMNDLRAAIARADEVLGCGAMPCRFKDTTWQTTNGRCVCLDHPRAGHVLAALYKAAKAAAEEDEAMNISPVVRLSPEQWARFQAICDDPSEPTDALKALFRDKPIHEERFVFTSKPGEFEFDKVPARGIEQATLEPYLNREVEFMGVRGTMTGLKMTSSCMTRVTNAGFAGAAQSEFLAERGLTCGCWKCLAPFEELPFGDPMRVWWMVVCPQCGNKRCPRAMSHDNACSGSNEPGQDGSEK